MREDTTTTPAEAPPSLVHPTALRDTIRWALRLRDDAIVEDNFHDLRAAIECGAAGCITLQLKSRRYRMSPVQSRHALEAIDLDSGRALIRTRHLLSVRSHPQYPATVRAFADAFGFPVYDELYRIEERLLRAGIDLPPNLRDNGCRLSPFALAKGLGMQFALDVTQEEGAATLQKLEGKRCAFLISRDWIVSEARASQQRRARVVVTAPKPKPAAEPPDAAPKTGPTIGGDEAGRPREILHRHEIRGKASLEISGNIGLHEIRRRQAATKAGKNPSGGQPHPHLYLGREKLADALEEGKCSPDNVLSYLRESILPELQRTHPTDQVHDVRWEQNLAKRQKDAFLGKRGRKG